VTLVVNPAAGTPVYQLNSGGPAVAPFAADAYFTGGTPDVTSFGAVDTSAVSNPAPERVYETERWGAFSYTAPGLTPGVSYTVRLHFAEIYFTAAGQRTFNVLINGTQVLTNFDIIVAAGTYNKAIVRHSNPKSSGIEIIR
jgi:hypothetical protein